jgi:hypothetical protein
MKFGLRTPFGTQGSIIPYLSSALYPFRCYANPRVACAKITGEYLKIENKNFCLIPTGAELYVVFSSRRANIFLLFTCSGGPENTDYTPRGYTNSSFSSQRAKKKECSPKVDACFSPGGSKGQKPNFPPRVNEIYLNRRAERRSDGNFLYSGPSPFISYFKVF